MGSQSSGRGAPGVPKTFVRYAGAIVKADICVPRAHPHAAWLLPWVEGLLRGESLEELCRNPPWPQPAEAVVQRHIVHTLIDLGWAVPTWTSVGLRVDAALSRQWQQAGRAGLARALFDADLIRGEWWADGLGGVLLPRAVAGRFDWDGKCRYSEHFHTEDGLLQRVEDGEPELDDLIHKLGGVDALRLGRGRAYLATPFILDAEKDLRFPLYGDEQRVLPAELGELEPVLRAHRPTLLGTARPRASRVVREVISPIEPLLAEIERLPAHPSALGPLGPVRARVARALELVEQNRRELDGWLDATEPVRPVVGPAQRHFDALREVCVAMPPQGVLYLSSAFLNAENAALDDGIADTLASAPRGVRFLVVYGHANDDRPEHQRRDADAWLAALCGRQPSLAGRVHVSLGKRRSHEKVVVSSRGDWMVGSWNAASGRPHATVFEASVSGCSARFAAALLKKIEPNVEDAAGERLIALIKAGLRSVPAEPAPAATTLDLLAKALTIVRDAVPDDDGGRASAWAPAVRALRAAALPLQARARLELIDEQQTRDALVGTARTARRDLLIASDRLAEGGLDRALLRDLRGDRRVPPLLRVVWGREWAGGARGGEAEALRRGRRAVAAAREQYGLALLADERPMENHAKLLVVDGVRGLVTSENLLSYGGEKDGRESRELGVRFWSASLARHLVGRAVLRWPHVLAAALAEREESPLAWATASNEMWHALSGLRGELDFDWAALPYLRAAIDDNVQQGDDDSPADEARRRRWAGVGQTPAGFSFVHEEATRLGLALPDERWSPWDQAVQPGTADGPSLAGTLLAAAQRSLRAVQKARPATTDPTGAVSPLIAAIMGQMVQVPAGRFRMGDDRVREEQPAHWVRISKPFWLGRTPVTQALWFDVMGRLPHLRDIERDRQFPIIQVSPEEMADFVARLNALPGGGGFLLPSEAQWEYACRAGSTSVYGFGDDPGAGRGPGALERYAWTQRNAQGRLQQVGQLQPNRWGLFDMHGLVYEACRDPMRRFSRDEVVDPEGRPGEGKIAARGGCWGRFPLDHGGRPAGEHFRSASRQWAEKSHRVSFRLARWVEEER